MEVAIGTSAQKAAAAQRVRRPERPSHSGLTMRELRLLLHALWVEGLALPRDVELLAPDDRM